MDLIVIFYLYAVMALEAVADTIAIPEGGTLRLSCILPPTADEILRYGKVRWLYNSLMVSEDVNVTMKMTDADRARFTIQRPYASDWFLVIKPAQRKDAGSYACVVNASTVISARVVIEYAPKIVGYPSRDIHMQVCERTPRVFVWCNVTGQPSPSVKWFYRKDENSQQTYRILTLDPNNPNRPGIMIQTGNAVMAPSNVGHNNNNDNNNNALTQALAGLVLLNVLE